MSKWIPSITALLLALMFSPVSQAADKTLRLHTLVKSPHPYNDMAAFIAKELEERSDSSIAVKIFDAGQLGKDDAVIGELGLGTIDLMVSSSSNAVNTIPEYQVFSMPYIFTGFDDLMARIGPGSSAESYFKQVYADRSVNMQLLALGGSGTRNLSNANGPVNSLSDIQGFKMRTPPSPMISKTWAELGTLPVTVAWGELYAAVQTGVAEALESSIPGYTGSKLYEVAPYLALTGHTLQVNHISMSDRSWGKLSAEQQDMLVAVAQEASVLGVKMAIKYESELVAKLKSDHGVTVTNPDVAEFKTALEPIQAALAQELNLEAPMAALKK